MAIKKKPEILMIILAIRSTDDALCAPYSRVVSPVETTPKPRRSCSGRRHCRAHSGLPKIHRGSSQPYR